jgi:hypothetical protein
MKKNGKKASSTGKRVAVKTSRAGKPKKVGEARELPTGCPDMPPTTPDEDAEAVVSETGANEANGADEIPEATNDASADPGCDTGEEGAPPAAMGKTMSLLDAAAELLGQAEGPMSCQELVEKACTMGLWAPRRGGKTPDRTLYSAILREITTKGDASRFRKTERGRFALNR